MTRATRARDVSQVGLWVVLLGPPVIWAVRFGVAYVLAPHACRADALVLLHALTVVALAAVAAVGVLAWRYLRLAGQAEAVPPEVTQRTRFIALVGLLGSLLFTVVIVAEGSGSVMIDPCTAWGPLIP